MSANPQADPASHRAYLEAEARALLDYIGRLPLDHTDRWILSGRYNEIKQELRALEKPRLPAMTGE